MKTSSQLDLDIDKLINEILSNKDDSDAKKKTKLEALRTFVEHKKNNDNRLKLEIYIPLVIAVITLFVNTLVQSYLAREQAKNQFDLQEQQASNQSDLQKEVSQFQFDLQQQQAKSQFQLQAAEMVANSSTPLEAQNKARALYVLFSDDLPSSFATADFNSGNFSANSISAVQEVITLIVEHPDQEEHIRSLWKEFTKFDITDIGSPDNVGLGVITWSGEATKLQENKGYYLKLLDNPDFLQFLEALSNNSDFQQAFELKILCDKYKQEQLSREAIIELANLFGLSSTSICQ
jgi:hypothetical protein